MAADTAEGGSVSWRYDTTTEPWLRALTALAAALLLGPYAALALAAAVILIGSAAGGNVDMLLLVGLLALVGGPMSLLYLWPLRDPNQRPSLFGEGAIWWFDGRQALALAAVGAAVTIAAVFADPRAPYALFLLGGCTAFIATLCSGSGRVDPDSGTVSTRYREVAIEEIESVWTHRLGPVTVVRFSGPGRLGSAPWWVLVPTRDASAVVEAIERGITATPDPTLDRERNRTVRVVAGLFALLGVGGGAAAFVAVDGIVGAYVGVMGACLGGLFAFVAYEG